MNNFCDTGVTCEFPTDWGLEVLHSSQRFWIVSLDLNKKDSCQNDIIWYLRVRGSCHSWDGKVFIQASFGVLPVLEKCAEGICLWNLIGSTKQNDWATFCKGLL